MTENEAARKTLAAPSRIELRGASCDRFGLPRGRGMSCCAMTQVTEPSTWPLR